MFVCVYKREGDLTLLPQAATAGVCVCMCGHVYVVYEDTNLYNDMGIT